MSANRSRQGRAGSTPAGDRWRSDWDHLTSKGLCRPPDALLVGTTRKFAKPSICIGCRRRRSRDRCAIARPLVYGRGGADPKPSGPHSHSARVEGEFVRFADLRATWLPTRAMVRFVRRGSTPSVRARRPAARRGGHRAPHPGNSIPWRDASVPGVVGAIRRAIRNSDDR